MDCQGNDVGHGWLTRWLTGRAQRLLVNGLSAPCLGCDADLLSRSLLSCLLWPQLSIELMTFCWGRWEEFVSRLLQTLNVAVFHQSSRMCWQHSVLLSLCEVGVLLARLSPPCLALRGTISHVGACVVEYRCVCNNCDTARQAQIMNFALFIWLQKCWPL